MARIQKVGLSVSVTEGSRVAQPPRGLLSALAVRWSELLSCVSHASAVQNWSGPSGLRSPWQRNDAQPGAAVLHRLFSLTLIVVAVSLTPLSVAACQYTVREIGFADLGDPRYTLDVAVGPSVSDETKEALTVVARKTFFDTNVSLGEVRADARTKGVAGLLRYEGAKPIGLTAPSAVASGERKAIESWICGIVDSPVRNSILGHVVESLGIVLLIEGPGADANKRARAACDSSVKMVCSVFDQFPKPVDEPPRVVTIKRDQRETEAVILWALDLPDSDEPIALIMHGRARRIGPAFVGDAITDVALYQTLCLIGADCECGLDRAWMRGRALPIVWTADAQERLGKALEFDVESPMVRMEMSMILAHSQATTSTSPFINEPAFGYRDLDLTFSDESDAGAAPRAQIAPSVLLNPDDDDNDESPTEALTDATSQGRMLATGSSTAPSAVSFVRWPLIILSGLVVAIALVGVVIFVLGQGRE